MTLLATVLVAWFGVVAAAEMTPAIVQAPDSPVKLDHAKILNVVEGEPAVAVDFDRIRQAAAATGTMKVVGPPPF